MGISIPDRIVAFDYGEVISRSPSPADRQALLDIAGVAAEPFWAAYDRFRDELDQGVILPVEYWARVGDEVGASWPPATVQHLWIADFRSWFSLEPAVLGLLGELREGGTRLVLLSNAGFDFGDPFRYSPMGGFFERVFVSAELGLIKPDPEIYRVVLAELGVGADELIFVDNKQVNVDGAASLGITAHRFVGVPELRAFLEGLAA